MSKNKSTKLEVSQEGDQVTLKVTLALQGEKEIRYEYPIAKAQKELEDRGYKVSGLAKAKIANNVSDRRREGFYTFDLKSKSKLKSGVEKIDKMEIDVSTVVDPTLKKKPRRKRNISKKTTE